MTKNEAILKVSMLEAENARLRIVASALLNKMAEVTADPRYLNAFFMQAIHGAPYDGPHWKDERDALKAEVER
jgi:hypothetical protein